jgi:hypothetical protein
MPKIIPFLILPLLFLFSFPSEGYTQGPETISIAKIRKNKTPAKLSYFGKKVDYIKLETNENCLIGKVAWCQKSGNNIVILNKTDKLFYIFDLEGNFIKKVGKIGKGPSEYLFNDRSSYIDSENQLIGIYDASKLTYLEYDFAGNCIKEFKIESKPEHVLKFDSNYVFFNPLCRRIFNDWFVLTTVSPSGKILGNFHRDSRDERYMNSSRNFYKVGEEIHYWETQRDTVYSFNGQSYKPIYALDLGKHKFPNELWFDVKRLNSSSKNYIIVLYLFESKNYLHFTVNDMGTSRKIVWDKKTKEGYWVVGNRKYHDIGWENDLDGGPIFSPGFTFNEDHLGQALEVITLKAYVDNGVIKPFTASDGTTNQKLIRMIEESSISDNPIIQIVQMK